MNSYNICEYSEPNILIGIYIDDKFYRSNRKISFLIFFCLLKLTHQVSLSLSTYFIPSKFNKDIIYLDDQDIFDIDFIFISFKRIEPFSQTQIFLTLYFCNLKV